MGLFNRIKNLNESINKFGNDPLMGLAKSLDNHQDKKVKQKAEDEARKQAIADGKIEPIAVSVKLGSDEKAFVEFQAKRNALVEKVVEQTYTKTKKKGGITRAVVGGMTFGIGGALVGAGTAKSHGTSTTVQHDVSSIEAVDEGTLIFTNKRILFVGKEIISIPHDDLMAVDFAKSFGGMTMKVKYAGMLKDEHYVIKGDGAKEADLYYKGITDGAKSS